MATRIIGLGGRLKAARDAAGLTQGEVAFALGLTRTMTVSEWERDKYAPDAEQAVRLAEHLGVEVAWLVAGEGEGPAEAA